MTSLLSRTVMTSLLRIRCSRPLMSRGKRCATDARCPERLGEESAHAAFLQIANGRSILPYRVLNHLPRCLDAAEAVVRPHRVAVERSRPSAVALLLQRHRVSEPLHA